MPDDVDANARLGERADGGPAASSKAGRGHAGTSTGRAVGTPSPPTPGRRRGERDGALRPDADAIPDGEGRRFAWRRLRWPAARAGRPAWWEVPPDGYLNVEARNGPTRPGALRALARTAAKRGLPDTDQPHPVQRFVEAHERARLAFHARRELSRVTAVASEVMAVDSRLADAEEQLGQAVGQRSAAAAAVSGRSADRQASAAGERTAGDDAARQRPAPGAGPAPGSGAGPAPGQRSRLPLLGPWAEAAILAAAAAGEAVLAYVAARDLGLALLPIGLLTLTVAISTVAAAQLAAHGIDRLSAGRDGLDDPHRRRWLDVGMGGAALASGMALAIGVGRLTARAGAGVAPHAGARAGAPACADCPGLGASHVIVLGLALLGLATTVAYAAVPDRAGAAKVHRWRAVTAFLRQVVEDRRGRRQLRVATAQEAAAHAEVRQLREELAVLVPQLFAAEQAALLFWSYQVAIGDAAQHALRQHLSAFATQRSRGVRKPLVDWWSGTAPVVPEVRLGFTSVGEAQWDWAEQMGRVTMAAKRVLVRRGLLDITYGLRLSRLEVPSADPGGAATRPAGGGRDPADGHGPSHGPGDGHGDHPPTVLPAFPLRQPDERA